MARNYGIAGPRRDKVVIQLWEVAVWTVLGGFSVLAGWVAFSLALALVRAVFDF